ncbi:MAG TPA: hypothetical protein VMW91_02965 [Desulfosporosinus sp.]|nr:hypothetical protein [Desulfosporosinus sp.]
MALKNGAPEAWNIMVRQQLYDALISLAAAAAIWVVLILVYCLIGGVIKAWQKKAKETELKEDPYGSYRRSYEDLAFGFSVGRNIAIAALVIITVFTLNRADVFRKLINPEYYAAKDLIHMLGK